MAQSSNLFGFFLEAAKKPGTSAAESVTTFADALNSALSAAKNAGASSGDVIPSVLRAAEKLDIPTVSRIVAATGLSLDVVASALETAQKLGLISQRSSGDAIVYDTTNEGKQVM